MLQDLENKKFEGIHYSRFIASWNNANTGKFTKSRVDDQAFRCWLRTITINGKEIPEEVVHEMSYLKSCGKLELENSAGAFEFPG